jgi:hypothetical protein
MIPMPSLDSSKKSIEFSEENAQYIEYLKRYEEIPVENIIINWIGSITGSVEKRFAVDWTRIGNQRHLVAGRSL